MKTWFTSRNAAITLSLIALLTLLARSYYDIRYILVDEYTSLAPWMDVAWIFGFTALIGANMVALLSAATSNSRGSWIALLIFNILTGFGSGAASLLIFTSNALELVIFTACLITGILAAASAGFQLRNSQVDVRQPVG